MANGNYDSQVTVGLVVDDSQLSKVRWPGDYTVKIKQEIDSKGLDKAAFLPNYTQTITQTVVQDASWRKAYFIGDRVATTTMRLDTRPFEAAYNAIPKGTANYNATARLNIQGINEVRAVAALLASLPNQFFVAGEVNDAGVILGLKNIINTSQNLGDVLRKLEDQFRATGNSAYKQFADGVIGGSLKMTNSVRQMEEMVKRIDSSKLTSQKDINAYASVQNFLQEGLRAASSGDYNKQMAWLTQYEKTYSGAMTRLAKHTETASKIESRHLRDLEAINNAYRNVSRAIEGVNAKAGQFGISQSKYKEELRALTKLRRDLDVARTSGDAVLINDAMSRIREGQIKDAARKAYGALGYLNTEKKQKFASEVSDARFDRTISGLRSRAESLGISIDKISGKGQNVKGLRDSLAEITTIINGLGTKTGSVERIRAVTEALEKLASTRNELSRLSVGASEYKKMADREESDRRKRLEQLNSLDSRLERAFTSASRKYGETKDMRTLYNEGKAFMDRAHTVAGNASDFQNAKKEINDIIRLIDEEARKVANVAKERNKSNLELERAQSLSTRINGVVAANEHLATRNTAIKSQLELLSNLSRNSVLAATNGRHEGKSFKEYVSDIKNAETGLKSMAREYSQLGTAINNAEKELRNIAKAEKRGITSSGLDAEKQRLEAILQYMRQIRAEGDATKMFDAKISGLAQIDAAKGARYEAQQNALQRSSLDAATEAAKKYASELDRITNGHRNNLSLASQLGQELVALYSLNQIRQFLTNIVQIGGQFEYQRAAIKNIIGDLGKANLLFEQIKDLALKSPFSTIQLDNYAKELSAFDVEYDQLFSKLKKLADISAGTGVDMSRIILAYGHVQASGYLEGMQRRQFSNANINVVRPLAEKYSREEGRTVTVKDVYKRISQKMVSASDLDEVLMAMAEPGGKFYNMQEEMANTTKAMWKNAGDAIDLMYLDLSDKYKGILQLGAKMAKGFATLAKTIAPNGYVLALGAMVVAYKKLNTVSSLFLGRELARLDKGNDKLVQRKNTLAHISRLYNNDSYKNTVSRGEGYMHLARAGQMTGDQALRLAYTGRMDMGTLKQIYEKTGIISKDQFTRMEAMNKELGRHTFLARRATLAWEGFKGSVASFFSANWPMMAITLGMSIFSGITNKIREAREQMKRLKESIEGSYESLYNSSLKFQGKKALGTEGMTSEERIAHIDEAVDILKENLNGAVNTMHEVFATKGDGTYLNSEIKQAEILQDTLNRALEAQKALSGSNPSFIKDAMQGNTKPVLNELSSETFEERLKQIVDVDIPKLDSAMSKLGSEGLGTVNRAIVAVAKNNGELNRTLREAGVLSDKGVKNTVEAMHILVANQAAANQLNEKLREMAKGGSRYANRRIFEMAELMNRATIHLSSLEGESMNVMKKTKDGFAGIGVGFNNTIDHTYDVLWSAMQKYLSNTVNAVDLAMKYVRDSMNDTSAFSVVPKVDKDFVVRLKDELKGIMPNIEVGTSIANAIQTVRGTYKSYKDEYNLIKNLTDAEAKKEAKNLKDKMTKYEQVARKLGFSLEDSKKGSGGHKTDTELETMRKEYQQMQNIVTVYRKYAETLGTVSAAEKLNSDEELKSIFQKYFTDGIVDESSIEAAYKGFLEKLGDAFKNGSSERQAFWTQVYRGGQDASNDTLKKTIDKIVSDVERELDKRKNRINIYEKIFDATGNDALAAGFAFGEIAPAGLDKLDVWDDTEWILDGFRERMLALKDSYGKEYVYDVLLGMTPEEMAKVPDEVQKAFDATRKEVEAAQNKQLEQMVSVMGNYQNIYQKLMAQRTKIAREQALIDVMVTRGHIDANYANTLKNQMNAQQTLAELRETLSYSQYMSNVLAMTGDNADKIGNSLRNALRDAFVEGSISAQQYAEELQKVHDIQVKLETESTTDYGRRIAAFMTQGMRGLRGARDYESDMKYRFALQQSADKAQRAYDEAKLSGADVSSLEHLRIEAELAAKRLADFTAQVTWFDEWQDGLKDANKWLGAMTGVVEGLSGAFKEVSDVFYSYGNKKMGNLFSNIADGVDVFGAVLSPVSGLVQSAMSGDIGGVLKNAIMAPVSIITGPIKAINALHDKRKQQQIDEQNDSLKDLVSSYKDLQRITQNGFGIQSDEWEKQRKNLEEQKKTQEEMLRLEENKKNTDDDAVRGYEEAIKDLDDQLVRFTEELYKSLYGIDFKAWSKQLGDAIWSAFESGNDAAIAWEQSVGDIMRNVTSQWMSAKWIEPEMEKLRDKYLTGDNAVWKEADDITEASLAQLKNDLSQIYGNVATPIGILNDYINDISPYNSNDNSASGLSKIGQNITEDTGSLIGSYMNSIHYDTSAMRTIADKQLSQLDKIATETTAIHNLLNELTTDGGSRRLNVRM